MTKRRWVVLACAGAFGILFAPSSASAAQPEPPQTSTATQSAPPTAAVPAPAPVVPAVSSPTAPSEPIASEPSTKGVFSLALEQFAGISVTGGKQGDPIVAVGLGQGKALGFGLGRLASTMRSLMVSPSEPGSRWPFCLARHRSRRTG